MAVYTVYQIARPKTSATYVTPTATDTVPADSTAILILHVKNAGGSSDVVTITDPGSTPAGSVATNPAVSVTNGTEAFIPLAPQYANSSGIITVAHSFTTSVTVAVLRND